MKDEKFLQKSCILHKGWIWNRSWCFRLEQEKTCSYIFSETFPAYNFLKDIISFIRHWNCRKFLYPGYLFLYPRLNQSLKWHFDYIIVANNRFIGKKKTWTSYYIDFLKGWSVLFNVNFFYLHCQDYRS